MSIGSRVLSVVFAAGLLASCDQLTMLRHRDLAFSYAGDRTGAVERASVDSDTQVTASAKRVATQATGDTGSGQIDVDETRFVRGTLNVVYRAGSCFTVGRVRHGASASVKLPRPALVRGAQGLSQ